MVHTGTNPYIAHCALTTTANLLNCDERSRSLLVDEVDSMLSLLRSRITRIRLYRNVPFDACSVL